MIDDCFFLVFREFCFVDVVVFAFVLVDVVVFLVFRELG